jgi:periplasmic protein TonB
MVLKKTHNQSIKMLNFNTFSRNKYFVCCFVAGLLSATAFAQNTASEDKIYEMFDTCKPPGYPGGEGALLKFFAENLQYPASARDSSIQGKVVIGFVVDKAGGLDDFKIIIDIGGGCGEEAVRVARRMPKWNVGEANGHPIKVRYVMPVRFRL